MGPAHGPHRPLTHTRNERKALPGDRRAQRGPLVEVVSVASDMTQRIGALGFDAQWVVPPRGACGQIAGARRQPEVGSWARGRRTQAVHELMPLAGGLAGGDPLAEDDRDQLVIERAAGTEAHVGVVASSSEDLRVSTGEHVAWVEPTRERRHLRQQPSGPGPVGDCLHRPAAPVEVQRAGAIRGVRGAPELTVR